MLMIEDLYEHYLQASSVCTDNRKLTKDCIFFALKGPNFNANKFALDAINSGARLAVVDDPKLKDEENCFYVPDVLESLQELAKHHRKQLTIPVIGITGSNGKTTSKELIREVLATTYKVLATKGNLNNHIGVPLTVLEIDHTVEIAIVEMGANHVGEIATLCEICQPNFGLITNIGEAHLEGFGGIEGVIKAKTELYKHLDKRKGLIFVNSDDPLLMDQAKDMESLSYGSTGMVQYSEAFADGFCAVKWNELMVRSQLIGSYNAANLGAAIAIGQQFEVDPALIIEAIEGYAPGNQRSQLMLTDKNKLIVDAYNANPSSMMAAINEFAANSFPNKLLILGDMFELGDYSKEKHAEVVALLRSKSLEAILIGEAFHEVAGHFLSFKETANAASYLIEKDLRCYTILLKGSRGMQLESLIDCL